MSEVDQEHSAVREFASAYVVELKRVLDALPLDALASAVATLTSVRKSGRTIFIAGNGGSAATANHMANDFALGVAKNGGKGFRAISLSENIATITAIANDESYEQIFVKQLDLLGQSGDVLVAISGSGNSPNVVAAATLARERGISVIGFLGMGGGALASLCDTSITVDSSDYGPIEDVHMMLDHLMTAWFRDFSDG